MIIVIVSLPTLSLSFKGVVSDDIMTDPLDITLIWSVSVQ